MKFIFSALLLAILAVSKSFQYFITIDAHSEECYFDKATAGTKLGLMFEVVEGGFLDIDLTCFPCQNKQ